jgi:glycosyltransferase involved in cell wall biosynthesis
MKPVVYGLLSAAAGESPRRYALITGLGSVFGTGQPVARRILRALLRLALQRASGVIFQNPDDRELFDRLGLARGLPTCVVRGSGVPLDHFPWTPVPVGPPRFLLLSRMIRTKGVELFVEAARRLRHAGARATWAMAGRVEEGGDAIPAAALRAWQEAGDVEYLGRLENVRGELARCTVCVLPSYYREGTPRSLLEAMSTGRAIITTDAPGCRETVFDAGPQQHDAVRLGRNGMLIPQRSLDALVAAMQRMVDRPDLATTLGWESRRLAELHYDVRLVDARMIEFMGLTQSA